MTDADYDATTALIVVDMQNDFVDPAGSLHVPEGETIVGIVNGEIARARSMGAAVTFTKDWHPSSTPHFAKDGGRWPVHCVAGSWGAELVPGLDADGPVVHKGVGGEDGYSGFFVRDPATGRGAPTELGGLLERRAIRRVVVVGLAADYCVKETAIDAVRLGFDTIVLSRATRAVDDGEAAFEDMRRAGVSVL